MKGELFAEESDIVTVTCRKPQHNSDVPRQNSNEYNCIQLIGEYNCTAYGSSSFTRPG